MQSERSIAGGREPDLALDGRYKEICCECMIGEVAYSTKQAEVLFRLSRADADDVLYLSLPWRRCFLVRTRWAGDNQSNTVRPYERRSDLLEDLERVFGPAALARIDLSGVRFPGDAAEADRTGIGAL